MEGTRNEKALIVLSSYVIGFTTAYIAYGITYAALQDEPLLATEAMTASVSQVVEEQAPIAEVTIDLVDSELSVNVAGESRLISVNAIGAVLSPASDMVYFCEQATDSENCVDYQYVIASDVIQPMDVGESVDAVVVE